MISFKIDGRPGFGMLKSQSGFVLIYTYALMAVLIATTVAYHGQTLAHARSSERGYNQTIAFNMAESALDQAISQLKLDSAYAGAGYTSLSSGSVLGGYSVSVSTPEDQANMRLISATGYSPSGDPTAVGYQSKTVSAYVQMDQPALFNAAVFANDSISFQGSTIVDSYNSNDGAYDEDDADDNGDLRTNSVDDGDVSIGGNAEVSGDIKIGPGGSTDDVISIGASASVSGSTSAAGQEKSYEVKTTNAATEGVVSLSGSATLALTPGVHRFTSISVTGNARIIPSGAVEIYVDGNVTLTGNSVSSHNNKAPNMIMYIAGSSVTLTGNGNYYGAFHAPEATVTLQGNGKLYGAVIAEDFTQTGNAEVHYDEALQDDGPQEEDQDIYLQSWNDSAKVLTA